MTPSRSIFESALPVQQLQKQVSKRKYNKTPGLQDSKNENIVVTSNVVHVLRHGTDSCDQLSYNFTTTFVLVRS